MYSLFYPVVFCKAKNFSFSNISLVGMMNKTDVNNLQVFHRKIDAFEIMKDVLKYHCEKTEQPRKIKDLLLYKLTSVKSFGRQSNFNSAGLLLTLSSPI